MSEERKHTFVALGIAGVIALSLGLVVFYIQPQILGRDGTAGISQIGGVTFGTQWRYVENVTLHGVQSSCGQLRLNCTSSNNQAREFVDGSTTAYVESGTTLSEPKSTYMIVLINGTSYCAAPQTTWIGQCSAEIGDSSQLYIYQSSINLSDPCTAFQEIGQTNASLSTPYSNVENSPKFIALEGNRTEYAFGGGDCGASTGTTAGSQLNLNFYYGDSMHPFKVCGNSTAIPTYQIDVGIDLTPTGYDLYHSVYSSLYFGPTNTTATCITPYTTTQYTLRSGETPLLASKDSLHASPALECAIEPHGLSTPWFALSSTFYRPVLNPR